MTFERFIYLLGAWTFSGGIVWAGFALERLAEKLAKKGGRR